MIFMESRPDIVAEAKLLMAVTLIFSMACLSGCTTYVGNEKYEIKYVCIDNDNDGYGQNCTKGPDCDDNNQYIWENCGMTCGDADGDGYGWHCALGPDCDDTDPNNWISCNSCKDADGDGYYLNCDAYMTIKGPDCDDGNYLANPGRPIEICGDLSDNNCNGEFDEGCPQLKTWSVSGYGNDHATSVIQTRDGNYVVASCGNFLYNIRKFDPDGNLLFVFSENSYDNRNIYSIVETPDQGYVAAGAVHPYPNPSDLLLYKLNKSGQLLWEKIYDGVLDDVAYSIDLTQDGGLIVAGAKGSYDSGGSDFWLLKLDQSGNLIWDKTYSNGIYDTAYSVRQTMGGGYVLAGKSESSTYGIWVMQLDANGNSLWDYKYPLADGYQATVSIRQIEDATYILTGARVIIKLDPQGNQLWSGTMDSYIYAVQGTYDESYMIGGNGFILKMAMNGHTIWEKQMPGDVVAIQRTLDGGYIIGVNLLNGFSLIKMDGNGECLPYCQP